MTEQPTHHGYAVNVKDHSLYRADWDALGEDKIRELYDVRQADFWELAADVAVEHGFRDVYSEGRMGGYAVPQPQPYEDMDDEDVAEWIQTRFRPFERDILALMRDCIEEFHEDVREALIDLEERREACLVRSEN